MGHLTFQQAQERHDNSLPPDGGPEPTEEQIDTAFGRLMHDNATLADYLDDWAPDTTSVFQLYQRAGLPLGNKTERDDELYESYTTLFDMFLRNYRDWLECKDAQGNSRLMAMADTIMEDEAREAREEAEDAAGEGVYWAHYDGDD